MGHLQDMTDEQLFKFKARQYEGLLESRRGHNYQYYSDKLQKYMDDKGYVFYPEHGFNYGGQVYITTLENDAKQKVDILKALGYYARIICGYERNTLRIKTYSIICKEK